MEIFKKLIDNGYWIYTPLFDVEGIDCIIHSKKTKTPIDIQIKTREVERAQFEIPTRFLDGRVFYFIILFDKLNEKFWIVPNKVFMNMSSSRKEGKERVVVLTQKNRERLKDYEGEIAFKQFEELYPTDMRQKLKTGEINL